MSETQIVHGYAAVLVKAVPPDQLAALCSGLLDTDLSVNYEGTLLFQTLEIKPIYESGLTVCYGRNTPQMFFKKAAEAGLPIMMVSVRPFTDVWYDGGDSNHDLLTLKKYYDLM